MGFQVCKTNAVRRRCVFDSRGSVGLWGRALLRWWACPVHSGCLGSLYRRWCVWKDHTFALEAPALWTDNKSPNRKGKDSRRKHTHTHTQIKEKKKIIHTNKHTHHQPSTESGAVSTPGSYPTHCLLSITFILCSSSSQSKPLIHSESIWKFMEMRLQFGVSGELNINHQ